MFFLKLDIVCTLTCPDITNVVSKYLFLCFHQRTPLDMATAYSNEAVVAYLKRVADLNMLEVGM